MSATQTCPACRVSITNDLVHFSNGSPGTRARLYARVCQFAAQQGCINKDPEKIGMVTAQDSFSPGRPIQKP
ncbi:hypothetical protein [Oscillatoria sp. FACHB-1406]|uniref:hypothetical protein n=1 Tax=Oscillatoria sp. FACHB-1406 TaxID=2692846 RepID=UPI001681D7AB|nr:hypothetical protein [Oscillatoria sp. FACHB-1406]MBD2576228.1 hypothetical protein [Oscillatoria sp. FACHB-1406]